MGLNGKLVEKIEIKAAGDVFHELVSQRPHEISNITPHKIHGCALHEGDWGKAGSIICWDYTHDGKKKVAKQVIETIDDENKIIKLKVIEGDLMELYKSFLITIHVQTHGVNNLVSWTFEYEKLNESVPEPSTLMQWVLDFTKDIESHHLGKIVEQIEIKVAGDVFHELFGKRPHEVSKMTPDKIHACDLQEGDWGKVGSIICWEYTHDGKKRIAKEVIEAIDEENKIVSFRVIDGDLMELYKNFLITIHVQTHGVKNLVTWTMEYEKRNEKVPEPTTFMQLVLAITKDIESHHLGIPTKAA